MKKSISSVIFLSLLFNVFSLFAMNQEIVLEDQREEKMLIDLPDDVLNYKIMPFLMSNNNSDTIKNMRLACKDLKKIVDNVIVQVDINDYRNGVVKRLCGAHPLKLEKIKDLIKKLREKISQYNTSWFIIGDKNSKKAIVLNKNNAKNVIYKNFERLFQKPYCIQLREYYLRGVIILLSLISGGFSVNIFWKNMSHLKFIYIFLIIMFFGGFTIADLTLLISIYAYDFEVEEFLNGICERLFRLKERERKFEKDKKSLKRVIKIEFLDA